MGTAKTQAVAKNIFDTINALFDDGIGSVSIGIAQTSVVGRDYEKLLKCADLALYTVKKNGKKQFVFYNDSMKGVELPE